MNNSVYSIKVITWMFGHLTFIAVSREIINKRDKYIRLNKIIVGCRRKWTQNLLRTNYAHVAVLVYEYIRSTEKKQVDQEEDRPTSIKERQARNDFCAFMAAADDDNDYSPY